MKKRLVSTLLAAALLPFCATAKDGGKQDSPASAPAKSASAPAPISAPPSGGAETVPGQSASAPALNVPRGRGGNGPVKAEEVGMFAEMLSISAGEKRVLTVPFRIDSCKTDSSNIKIEHVSGNTFEISGALPGRATITVVAGGVERQYNVTVFNSTLQTYQELSRLLEELPEVTLELYDGGLVLQGVITRPAHWEYFRRLIRPYEQNCRSYVAFMPDASLIAALKKQLTDAGFPVVEKSGPQFPGKLSFRVEGNVLTVAGYLLSDRAIESVKSILASRQWLNPEWNGDNFRVVTDLAVAPTQIDLGIVFVGVTRTQLERLGNSSADGKVLSWDVIGWFKALYGGSPDAFTNHGEQHVGGSVLLQTDLKGSLLFFGNNGISDFRDSGHITLTNNGAESTFENGGSRNVMIYGQDSADLKEIKFGLNYKAKALLRENGMVQLDLELERSLPPVKDGNDYIQRTSKTKTSLLCPLGKTAVIAGQKELTFTKNGPSGYAFLRHIPVINWFASFEEDVGEQTQILVLVSPELMRQSVRMTAHPATESATLEQEVSAKVAAEARRVRENEDKSWFRKIFVW